MNNTIKKLFASGMIREPVGTMIEIIREDSRPIFSTSTPLRHGEVPKGILKKKIHDLWKEGNTLYIQVTNNSRRRR